MFVVVGDHARLCSKSLFSASNDMLCLNGLILLVRIFTMGSLLLYVFINKSLQIIIMLVNVFLKLPNLYSYMDIVYDRNTPSCCGLEGWWTEGTRLCLFICILYMEINLLVHLSLSIVEIKYHNELQ